MASSSKQPQGRDKTGKVEVTILAPEWGSSKGGLSTVIRELAIQLAKFPFVQVTLFLPKCSHKNKDEAEHHGISIVEAERQPGYEELDWLSFPPEDLQIDVVVGHGVKLGRQAPIIRKYHKCKWVQVVHTDPEELGMFKSYENPISKGEQKHYVEVELCQMADLVVAVGPKLTEAFRKYLGCCKNDQDVFEFIPGIFADFATVKQVPAKGKHRSVLVFGCGDAKDFELNGFDMAARSVAALPHSHLVVVGVPEGKHREFTERFIGLGVPANRLIVKDYKDREALKRLFCEVDLMLVASRTEGFDLIGVEALSAGLPVIVSKNSWFGEALGSIPFGSSFVIDSEDPSVWTAAIKGIWNKDRQVQLDESKILHDCYGKKYSWSEQCKNLLEKVVNLLENEPVAIKEMNKEKKKQHIKEMEKRSSAEEIDMTEVYTDKPVQEQVPDQAEEVPVEDTTQTQHEETTGDALSDDETWEDKEDACLPDLEDASDARADGAKLTYGRDFLLQFQTNPLSMMKPEGLPDIDVVLVQARPPSKSGSQQNRMPKGNGGENMFLPSFMRQMSKGNPSGSRSGRNRNVTTKKVIELPSMQQQPDLKRVDNRWVRPSEVTKGGNEEEAKTQELFRKVRGILNKLTPQKFQTLTQQIIDLDIDTQERLEGAIDLIFAKAIDEATFSVAYAKMCQFLVSENKKVVVEKDGVKKDISFRKILLNRCQKEFEKENSIEKTINEKLADLVNQGLNEEELQKRKSDLEDQVHQAKRRTLGNIRFIGELFKLKMLTESIMHDCVVKLLRSNDEESFECLCKLLVTIGKDLDHEKGKPRVDQYFTQINKIISAKITSSRVRRMMQDIVDLRNNNWVPRREDNNLKTIDQIHKEAADQAKKTQIKIQMAKQERKLQRAKMAGRDSPRPGSIPQADESWTTVGRGPRNMSVDQKKFRSLKRQMDSENISPGAGGRGYGFWARGSSDGTGAVAADAGPSVNFSAVPELTKETMKKKTLSIIDEFLYIKDMKEVAECLKEIGSPSRHHVFVEVTFNHTMEKRTSERQLTGKLIHFLLRDGVLTSQEYLDGLNSVFEVAEDTEIDIPQLWKYLGELMGPSAFDGNLGLDVVFKCVFQHVQKHKAARLFACMLQSCEKSPEDVRAFLRAHNINLNIFFDDAEEAREFAKDKNIEYALGPASPSANQYSAKVEEELRNIILKRKARNEEVMDWIDENVSPSSKKGASFIRALVTVVCEIALEEEGEVCKCNIHKLKDRKNLLQKYIDANTDLEVQALYAVQALFLRLGRPQGFIKSYFDSLFDEEIITEVSFNTWESSVEEEPGKGVTVMAASEFFRWLRSATEDIDQEI
ncbi:eukaryotic translation initiation factor 4 gamma 1-like isoform X3 [Acropora millepora]|uniref:eukaryotic translation initiation factor 4 gamma 1-like isoform X3 n=1 Tax=Acropora millepora TaxID=45264 RepID=UPI001CF3AC45|nr:eukaryotic translation initiation factor 4 gamma 1-like isoform X3 [Acropora millepora]